MQVRPGPLFFFEIGGLGLQSRFEGAASEFAPLLDGQLLTGGQNLAMGGGEAGILERTKSHHRLLGKQTFFRTRLTRVRTFRKIDVICG
ncbi:MAG: hypothetical protein IT428_18350 [Planctomycetaceae bacterium]|nr:hypothetical protein [Planctomycetaceae bacterium]